MTYFEGINFRGLDNFHESLCLSKSQISKKVNVLGSLINTIYVDFFRIAIGSDSDLNENDKDPYQQFVQENEIEICEEILKDVDNILH